MSYSPDPDTSSVFACLAINGILGLVFYSLFEIFRSKELEVYAPRLRSHKDAVGEKPSNSLFGWIGPTWRATDDEVLRIAGMDGYVMLRFLRMCTTIGGHCCLGLVVLLPVYATAPGNPNVNGINKISMANLIEGGDRLWVSLLFYYAFTFVFLYFIYKEYENFAAKRRHFFREGDATINPQVNYSVQVENIPVEYRSSKKLESFFNYLFPREIICASVSVGCPALVEAVAKRKIAVNNLEKAVALMEADDNRTRPTLSLKKGKPALCGGDEKNVDSISYWENEISTLNYTIAKLKVDAARLEADEVIINKSVESGLDKHLLAEDTPDPKQFMTCTGFVTFSSRRSQSTACQVPILSDKYPDITVSGAPATKDIIWKNLNTTTQYIKFVSTITAAVYYTCLLFWGIILAFVAAVSTLSNLESFLPFIKDLDSVSYAILAGQLPVIVLMVFLILIPIIMAAVSTYIEKRKTYSAVELEVFQWFFLYQIANVFLLLITGSLFGALSDAIDEPTSILNLIGAALPTVSIFFINFSLTSLLSGIPMLLLRLVPFIIVKLYKGCFNQRKLTRRTLVEGPYAPFRVNYGTTLPPFLYFLCIMLVYWVISPILMLVITLFFSSAYFVWKYQYLYVVDKNYESGGKFWYGLYSFSMVCMMASSILMLVFLGIKQFALTPLMLPLPFIIYIAWSYTDGKFKRLSMFFPYSSAVATDLDRSLEVLDEEEKPLVSPHTEAFKVDFVRQPELSEPSIIKPYPYRINNVPLLDDAGCLSSVYHTDIIPEDAGKGNV